MFIFIYLLLFIIGFVSANVETDLRKKLMDGYDPSSLPLKKTNVSFGLTVLYIDMDEENQVLMVDAWAKMEWNDPRLKWNEASNSDISNLAFKTDDIWTPDLTLYNNAKAHISDHMANYRALVFSSGKVLNVPTAKFPAPCLLDMTYWPHDKHKCSLKFGSWVHSGYVLNITSRDNTNDIQFESNTYNEDDVSFSRGAWKVLNSSMHISTKYYECCPEPYMSVKIAIEVERTAPAYCWVVKIPAIVLCAMTGILFLLPPGSVEKIIVGTLLLLLDMQFLAYTHDVVQHSPTHVPLIVQLVTEQLVLTLLCLLVAVVILRMVRGPHSDTLPNYLQKCVSVLEWPLCLSGYRKLVKQSGQKYPNANLIDDHQHSDDKEIMMSETGNTNNIFQAVANSEWLMFGALMDKCFFFVYVIVFVVKLIRYSAVV